MKLLKKVVGWRSVVLLALLLRLFGLGLNPVGLSHDDELHNLINAKSLAMGGGNVPGVVAGELTQNGKCLVGDCIYGELESYGLIPWMRFFPLDNVLSKIPFVLVSVGLVFVVGKLFENLSNKKSVGVIAGLLMTINPWEIYYGRTAYAYTFTFFFFILATYFFTRERSQKSNLIWGAVAAFIASLFYFGAKPIMPLVILWGVIYNLYQSKMRYWKFVFVFGVVVSVLVGGYFYLLVNSMAGKRLMETGLTSGVVTIGQRMEAYFGFFSPVSLFLTGQRESDNYFMSGQGYFYLIELPFLILGIIAVIARKKKAWMILVLIGIGVLPAAIKVSGASMYSLRAALAYPLMSGVVAWGYYYVFEIISDYERKNKQVKERLSKIFLLGIGIAYIVSVTYFMFLYWHRLPREQASRWFFQERVLTSYISRVKGVSRGKVIVLTSRPDGIFNSYIFWGGVYNEREEIGQINESYLNGSFEHEGVKFASECGVVTEKDLRESVIFVDQINQVNCDLPQDNTAKIANPKDAGGMFNVINDKLCGGYVKSRFPMIRDVRDFSVERMSDEEFCKLWITNPDNY